MVSNAIDMELKDLLAALRRIRRDHKDDADYKEWRAEFPKSWPM